MMLTYHLILVLHFIRGAGPSAVYQSELTKIATKLKAYTSATSSKLVFGLTTPWLCTSATDTLVQRLNTQARAVMQQQAIPTIDFHAAIVGKCGNAPVSSCFGSANCFCPHCGGNGGAGYEWLVNHTIAPAMRKMLLAD